jgi:hypothetical protein
MRLSVKLVLAEVVAEVFAVVSSEVEDPRDQKLSLAFAELSATFSAIVFITSGEFGALGDDGPAPLSTLRSKRCAGFESEVVCPRVEPTRGKGWRTRLAVIHARSLSSLEM